MCVHICMYLILELYLWMSFRKVCTERYYACVYIPVCARVCIMHMQLNELYTSNWLSIERGKVIANRTTLSLSLPHVLHLRTVHTSLPHRPFAKSCFEVAVTSVIQVWSFLRYVACAGVEGYSHPLNTPQEAARLRHWGDSTMTVWSK